MHAGGGAKRCPYPRVSVRSFGTFQTEKPLHRTRKRVSPARPAVVNPVTTTLQPQIYTDATDHDAVCIPRVRGGVA